MIIDEILIVKHNDISFGIPTVYVGQILRVPDITPMTMAPQEVRGLSAVGGTIATVLDFNALLGLPKCEGRDQKNRVITLEEPFGSLCLLVDEVSVSITVDQASVEYLDDPTDAIAAIIRHDDVLIQVVNLEYAVGTIHKTTVSPRKITDKHSHISEPIASHEETMRYLVFKMGTEEYAMLIDNLREILTASAPLTAIAGANDEVLGMMSLRDELIVVVDLRVHYSCEPHNSEKSRIMIVERNNKTLGLMVDEIVDIFEFGQSCIEVHSAVDSVNQIEGIIQHEERLISLLGNGLCDLVMATNEEFIIANNVINDDIANEEASCEVVVFKLGKEEYAFPIEEVAEIIDMTDITPVVNAPAMVDGIINIRGQIVTIGSLHKRLGIINADMDNQKILICHAPTGRIGFFVSSVSDVLGIQKNQMVQNEDGDGMFSDVLHLDDGKRLVLLFAPDVSKLAQDRV
jgi:purine-binding chemotaxis protein CheW